MGRPLARLAAVIGAGALAGLSVAGTMLLVLRDPFADQEELAERAAPALAAVHHLEIASLRAEAGVDAMTHSLDDLSRAAGIAQANSAQLEMGAAWQDYLAHAVGAPGERAIQRRYELATGRLQAASYRFATISPGGPDYAGAVQAARDGFADQRRAIDELDRTIYGPLVAELGRHVIGDFAAARTTMLAVAVGAFALYLAVVLVVARAVARDERRMAREERVLGLARQQAEFEAALHRGLELANSEPAALAVARRALTGCAEHAFVEVLMAGDDGHTLHRVFAIGDGGGCGVCEASECPAMARSHPWIVPDSGALDACAQVAGSVPPVWSACMPLLFGGKPAGVVRASLPAAAPPGETLEDSLEVVARRVGERLGALRLLDRAELHARIDPLTGLANRRWFDEIAVEQVVRTGRPYVAAFIDIDHFKELNDSHGHDAGDRALELFARVLRDSVRPGDVIARYGGEEFVVLLPDCSLERARVIAERIRRELAAAVARGEHPTFTVTIGLAAARPGEDLDEVVTHADLALLAGKARGRDRVVVFDDAGLGLAEHAGASPGDAQRHANARVEPPIG